jgi:hypothetical protein
MQTKKILASTLSEKLDFKIQILAQCSNFENSYLRNERSYRVEIFIKVNYEKRFIKYLNFKVIQGQKL